MEYEQHMISEFLLVRRLHHELAHICHQDWSPILHCQYSDKATPLPDDSYNNNQPVSLCMLRVVSSALSGRPLWDELLLYLGHLSTKLTSH